MARQPPDDVTAPLVDVLVVGAGPVGLALAADLARRGVSVRVVDTLDAPTTQSRAIVVHSRTLDHLQALGALDGILARARTITGMALHTRGHDVGRIPFDAITATHPYSVSLLQTDTEAVLAERLAALGVTVERSTTLTGATEHEGHVVAETARGDGTTGTVRARYVVGADGARSAVRHVMGEHLEGSFAGDDFLIGDVDGDHGYDRSSFHTFFSPGDTTSLLFPLPGDRVRVLAQLPDGTDPDRQVTQDWLQHTLDERGVALRIRTAHWLTRFRLKHGQVGRYRQGRFFVAGDAAHIHSPAGGLGMNTGLHDAANLGWKLARAVQAPARDGSADALLDSYHAERHPVGADVIAFATRLTRVGTLSNPVAQRVRDAVVHLGLQSSTIVTRLSETVEQQRVRYRDSPVVRGEGGALRPGDFLHLPDTDVGAALARTPGHLAVVLPDHDPGGLLGGAAAPDLPIGVAELAVSRQDAARLADATGLRHGGVVLVRPDGYVGYLGPAADATGLADYLRVVAT
ncbi:FAD-dependent monooxygenase [Cellulosimicrobium sp. NPDC057127]|uniref:FAD-dependent monooxygenase n=1 Tax=Cellulosimicrobium sp. NPDC057127 TaxID=3346026 RepID=UPI003645299D